MATEKSMNASNTEMYEHFQKMFFYKFKLNTMNIEFKSIELVCLGLNLFKIENSMDAFIFSSHPQNEWFSSDAR